MFEPDLGSALGAPDDLLDAPTSDEAGATIGDPSTSTSHAQDEGAKGHHGSRGAVPDGSDEGDLEVDLTGALDAIGKPSTSINDALGKVVSRPGRPDGPQNAAGPVHGTTAAGRALAPTAAENVENVEPIAGQIVGRIEGPIDGPIVGRIEGPIVGRIEGPIDAVSEASAAECLEPSETELEAAFDGLIEQVAEEFAQLPRHDQSSQLMLMAETYQTAGMIDEARAALEQAAADRRYRFQATAALGRLYRRLDDPTEAVRWLEAAAQAPPPTADDRRALLYDLADTLERTGEATRALANWLDLLAEQDDYRDVRSRIDRLVRTQS
jgi:hypothetical protein